MKYLDEQTVLGITFEMAPVTVHEYLKDAFAEIGIELNAIREFDPKPTLRDQFAMAAMTAIVAQVNGSTNPEWIAKMSYQIADEMLKASEGK